MPCLFLIICKTFLNRLRGVVDMKIMHVHAKSNIDIRIPEDELKELPDVRWGVVTTIQDEHKMGVVLEQLRSATHAGQVLGCNAIAAEKINEQVDEWLFIGSGEFHPVQVALKTGKRVWLWNPASQELGILPPERVESWRKRKQAQVSGFLNSNKIGIIVSTKIGQKNLMRAKELAKKGDKEYFIFACDELHMSEFENFNFVEFWVNTACPRIPDDNTKMVNIDDLIDAGVLELEKEQSAYELPIWKSEMGLKKDK